MVLKILLGGGIFYVTGLYLLVQSFTDFLLRREIFAFNWRLKQWHQLTGYHANLLTLTRFGYGCLLLITLSTALPLIVFFAWLITEIVLGYQQLPKQKRVIYHDPKGKL